MLFLDQCTFTVKIIMLTEFYFEKHVSTLLAGHDLHLLSFGIRQNFHDCGQRALLLWDSVSSSERGGGPSVRSPSSSPTVWACDHITYRRSPCCAVSPDPGIPSASATSRDAKTRTASSPRSLERRTSQFLAFHVSNSCKLTAVGTCVGSCQCFHWILPTQILHDWQLVCDYITFEEKVFVEIVTFCLIFGLIFYFYYFLSS